MIRLFLDDERMPLDCINYMQNRIDCSIYQKTWIIVRCYDDFVYYITENGLPDIISFDHDLADFKIDREYTGKDCANWLINYCIENNKILPDYVVHSANTHGIINIKSILDNFKKYSINK